MPRSRPLAFTLIELLVVISIIALLIGILLPALGAARAAATSIKCLAAQRDLGIAISAYATDLRGDLPSSEASGGGSFDASGNYVRWPGLLAFYYGIRNDSSAIVFEFDHFKCPTQIAAYPTNANGVFAYNNYFRGIPSALGQDWTWRRQDSIQDPGTLPLLTDANGDDGGGMHLDYRGPHPIARLHGWDPANPTKPQGPAANHEGTTNYLFADMHAAGESEIWPWTDFSGTSFHPRRDITITP